MSNLAAEAPDPLVDLPAYVEALEKWLAASPPGVLAASKPNPSYRARVEALSGLMKALFDEGFGRYGWPPALGGLGGTIFHRAAMWECLARHHVPGMGLFEHVEILMPALCALAPREFMSAALPSFLAGRERWAQGFSEPGAGSDLASLRTRATPADGGYRIRGRKIWTSWAVYATWCLVLARTGAPDSRHRGLTAFIVDLRDPGVDVTAIEQANGTDELAEVALDDVFVPGNRVVGTVDGGWSVAMRILDSERGSFAWFRHCFLYDRLLGHLADADPESDRLVGETLLDLAAVSAAGYDSLCADRAERRLGPDAAFTKLLLCHAERAVFDRILEHTPELASGVQDARTALLRQEYLFSRIVTVYGGSQQMQLETVAKKLFQLP